MDLRALLESNRELSELVASLIRVGEVTSTDPGRATARVRFQDRDDVESYDLQVLSRGSLNDKFYHMPDVGEPVLCLFLPSGVEAGFILGAYYPAPLARPADSGEITSVEFKDGTRVEYDRADHTLTVDVPAEGGNVVVNAHTRAVVNSPKIDLGESADLEPSVLGDALAAWVENELKPWLDNHQHIGNFGQPTSPASDGPVGEFPPGEGAAGGAVYSKKNRNQ